MRCRQVRVIDPLSGNWEMTVMRFSVKTVSGLIIGAIPVLTGCPRDDGFENHLDEAIELYGVRKVQYAEMTAGRSDALFDLLMATEKAVKPIARYIDWRATPFIDDGIPIVVNDFVSMAAAGDIHDPIEPVMEIPEPLVAEIRELIAAFHSIEKTDVPGIANAAYNGVLKVSEWEARYQVQLPMLRHVIESIGYGALHAVQYSAMSGGETDDVAREFLSTQILGLGEPTIVFDSLANEIHQQGVGVLVNDLPCIPFVEEYEGSDLARAGESAFYARGDADPPIQQVAHWQAGEYRRTE
ncbi:MAG: hypothetical protein IT365_11475 [Candidatus Hydrogenedentes bacterium]|nr:hypothetical protein [Candidatus Hydrogenedentota bacterium]